ncbi:hypothetical protein Ccrd_005534 [Cynara cardunculus var. scolymus]|uniref:C2H2-type domain-containing protein n=1 Tax=Cynara cardunculus var. scolymus TaxID=59895 RepID=A0A118JUP8_CYNCS|nr:hypothetical protein Ccrd_005534 [Cynara cardunculus var. scolymus]
MIKRRFYKQEHGDKDAASGSSSSSDSELDAEASVDTEEEEDYDNNMVVESRKKDQPCSSSSGYESEDSSGNEVNLDASGLPTNDDVSEGENYKQDVIDTRVSADNHSDKNTTVTTDVMDCVLKSKSVFKCKLCPRIVCLTEETLKAHLKSKRHARSEKLLKEGRLKMMLNSDGEIEGEEDDGETHQERHAATLALSNKNASQKSKKNKGRQRQRKRLRKKTSDDSVAKKPKKSAKKPKSDI